MQKGLIQALTAEKAFLVLVSPIQALLALASSVANEPTYDQHEKHIKQVYIASPSDICSLISKYTDNNADSQLFQYTASKQDVVTLENFPSNVQVFKPRFVRQDKRFMHWQAQEKNQLVIQAYNVKKNLVLTQLPI